MNAPAALYWYHQQPSTAGYRNSSGNSTGPWTSAIDPTGKPGVFGLVKYVPEVIEGVSEYERGLKDSAALWRKELAAEREKVANELVPDEWCSMMAKLANGLERMTKLASERACIADNQVCLAWVQEARAMLVKRRGFP